MWCRVTVFGPGGVELGNWTLGGPGASSLEVVDRLARLHLATRYLGGRIAVREVSGRLAELLELVGLAGEVGG